MGDAGELKNLTDEALAGMMHLKKDEGDRLGAFAELFDRFSGPVAGVYESLSLSPELVDDLTDDLFTRILEKGLGNYDPAQPVWPYLQQMARNLASGHLRLKKNQPSRPLPRELPARNAPGPDEVAAEADQLRYIQVLIHHLPKDEQEVINGVMMGETRSETCQKAHMSPEAYSRARPRALREVADGLGEEVEKRPRRPQQPQQEEQPPQQPKQTPDGEVKP